MYSIVSTAIVHGIDSIPVQVEADVSVEMAGITPGPENGWFSWRIAESKGQGACAHTALRNADLLPAKRMQ